MAEAACSTRDPNDYWCLGLIFVALAASVARPPDEYREHTADARPVENRHHFFRHLTENV